MRVGLLIATEGQKIDRQCIADALEVDQRTLRNWRRWAVAEKKPKIGRPAHDERVHRKAFWRVGREFLLQRGPSWRSVAAELKGEVPTQLVQKYVGHFKSIQRRRKQKQIERNRIRVEVLTKNALWVQDATHVGRLAEDRSSVETVVVKDRGPLRTIGQVTEVAPDAETVITLLDQIKAERGLPLVIGSDNGSPFCNEDVEAYLEREQVIHLKSLPRTPQHNGASEVGIGEIKRAAGLGKGVQLPSTSYAHAEMVKNAAGIDCYRPRPSKGFKTACQLDDRMPEAYTLVERARFYRECSQRMAEAKLGKKTWRAARLAERGVIFGTMEHYKLINRYRGGRHDGVKAEIFS